MFSRTCLLFRFTGVTVICSRWLAQTGCSPPTNPKQSPQQITLLHLDLHGIAAQHSACWHVLHVVHAAPVSLSVSFFFLNFPPLAAVSSVRKTGATVKASHCRQMLFSIWHDASSRSHFHCDCRAPSESIDNPCQVLAPPTGAGTAS